MFVKKVKRKCNVRNCKNIDCYAISKTHESGNSVIICRDCLKEALNAVDNGSSADERQSNGIPPLFFNHVISDRAENVSEVSDNIEETTEEPQQKAADEVKESTAVKRSRRAAK